MIILELFGAPIPWKRPGLNKRTGGVYDQQAKEKEQYRWQLRSQFKDDPLSVPMMVKILFRMPIVKSTKGKAKRLQMISGMLVPTKKPDADNLAKLVLDSMTGIIYQDDSQVVDLFCSKRFSEKPGVSIRIIPMTNNTKQQSEFDEMYESYSGDDFE
jgi:Holliday junction resolvase RusA-like endonuclease